MHLDDKLTQKQIAVKLHIDPSTVSTKLKAMGYKTNDNHHQLMDGGYPCQWCGKIMVKVWQNKGPRKQKYCNSKCSERAKDYRRMRKYSEMYSEFRINKMKNFLKIAWGNDWKEARDRILQVKPLTIERTNMYDNRILISFKKGMELDEIAKRIGISASTVKTRLSNHILIDYVFEIKYFSELTGRWKTMRTAKDFKEIKRMKIKLIERLRYVPKFKIKSISTRPGRMSLTKQMKGIYESEVNKIERQNCKRDTIIT